MNSCMCLQCADIDEIWNHMPAISQSLEWTQFDYMMNFSVCIGFDDPLDWSVCYAHKLTWLTDIWNDEKIR